MLKKDRHEFLKYNLTESIEFEKFYQILYFLNSRSL